MIHTSLVSSRSCESAIAAVTPGGLLSFVMRLSSCEVEVKSADALLM